MKKYKPKNINEELLREVINKSKNYIQVLNELKLRGGGNNYNVLKNWIKYFNIDVSHFETAHERGKRISKLVGFKSKPLEQILIKNLKFNSNNLKHRLYKEGLKKRECELCGQGEEWNKMKISLILDHIDGDHLNNELSNLRIVCPNCNAGLDTFCSKNRVKDKNKLKNTNKREEYNKIIREKFELINKKKKEIIYNSNIDFSKHGWRLYLAKILNQSPQNVGKFIKKNMPEIWEKAKKHSS